MENLEDLIQTEVRPVGRRTIIAGSRSIVQQLPEWQQRQLDELDEKERLQTLKVILDGIKSRTINQIDHVVDRNRLAVSEVVSGCAPGVDMFAIDWALYRGIVVRRFPANWNKYGKAAGFRRNYEMAEYAMKVPLTKGQLIAIWDGKSRGTEHMIRVAEKSGLNVYVVEV